ncbi:MAG: hypothetical protein GF363_09870, partial [Chitinivibrionales bacterium]|nr:hypothetical protein [Chitinivibrionales bacterium]
MGKLTFSLALRRQVYVLSLTVMIFVSPRVHGFSFDGGRLPNNSREAAELLAAGELDTTLWTRIAQYYDEPVVVPQGELYLLRDVFPWLPGDLPVSSKDLAPYEPWTAPLIDTFYMDYPSLVPFGPILSFKTGGLPHVGAASFSSRSPSTTMPARHTARFRVAPNDRLKFEAAVGFDRIHARWGRRRVKTTIPLLGDFEAGNVHFDLGAGLFYG